MVDITLDVVQARQGQITNFQSHFSVKISLIPPQVLRTLKIKGAQSNSLTSGGTGPSAQ